MAGKPLFKTMWSFIIRRLIMMIPTALIVIAIAFLLMRLIPGDPAVVLLGPGASDEQIEALRRAMGLDQPVLIQFAKYFARVIRGDLGMSIYFHKPVIDVIVNHIEASVLLGALGMCVVVGLGIPAGIISAVKSRTWLDQLFLTWATLGASIPSFWLGLMLMFIFSTKLQWLPSSGFHSILFSKDLRNLRYLVLPALTLGFVNSALIARITRSSMLDVLRQPYMDAAKAKGLSQFKVILLHGLRNAAIPIVTVMGFVFAGMIAAAVVTENVFALPGIGRLIVHSVLRRDYPVIQGVMLFVAVLYLFINLVTDIVYAILDPRIRLE